MVLIDDQPLPDQGFPVPFVTLPELVAQHKPTKRPWPDRDGPNTSAPRMPRGTKRHSRNPADRQLFEMTGCRLSGTGSVSKPTRSIINKSPFRVAAKEHLHSRLWKKVNTDSIFVTCVVTGPADIS